MAPFDKLHLTAHWNLANLKDSKAIRTPDGMTYRLPVQFHQDLMTVSIAASLAEAVDLDERKKGQSK